MATMFVLGFLLVSLPPAALGQFCIPYVSAELHPFEEALCGDSVNTPFGQNYSVVEAALQIAHTNSSYLRGADILMVIHKFLHWCEHEMDAIKDLFYNVTPFTTTLSPPTSVTDHSAPQRGTASGVDTHSPTPASPSTQANSTTATAATTTAFTSTIVTTNTIATSVPTATTNSPPATHIAPTEAPSLSASGTHVTPATHASGTEAPQAGGGTSHSRGHHNGGKRNDTPHRLTRRGQALHELTGEEVKEFVDLISGLPPSCLQHILELHIGWIRGPWLLHHPEYMENSSGDFVG